MMLTAVLLAAMAPAVAAMDGKRAEAEARRTLVADFYDRFFNQHRVREAAQLVAEDYRQHNPQVPDGRAPFVAYFEAYFRAHPASRARIVRSAVDGDLVYLHVHSTRDEADPGQAVVDIFRVQEGLIVEHWDVIQAVPEQAANGNSMF